MSMPPESKPGAVYEIRYSEIFPWLILVRSLRVSLLVRVLMLALAGVLLTQWGWLALDSLFSSNAAELARITDSSGPTFDVGPLLAEPIDGLEESHLGVDVGSYTKGFASGPLARSWGWLTDPFVRSTSSEVTWGECFVLMLSGTWAVLVWAIFGGAITRIAALNLTRGETLGPLAALQHAFSKWFALAGGPLVSLVAAAALAVPLVIAGFVMRLDLFALLIGFLWVFALSWGLLLAVVLLGLLFGWPLMWATIGVERSDAFDSVSRCYAYVFQRPLHLIFYLMVASILGLLGELAVQYFAMAGVQLTDWTVSWGMGNSRMEQLAVDGAEDVQNLGLMVSWGAAAMSSWKSALLAVAASYPLGFLWSSAAGIYLLLRRHIDSTEIDEINLDQEEPTTGLPSLSGGEQGVPQVEPTGGTSAPAEE